jgi:UDP-N-acetylmuramoylalanine--D-glutamate ligase
VTVVLDGAAVFVAGLGVSGAAAARALVRAGAVVLAVDGGEEPAVCERAAALEALGAEARVGLGVLDPSLLDGRELVVPSPGMRESEPLLVSAADRGVPVWSEPELAWRLAPATTRLVAVTGTNGKTSTTELLAGCLQAPAAGNIGVPLVDLLAGDEPPPLVVAELSSFQLRFCQRLRPHVAVVLNVAPDHLDWHPSIEAYFSAKAQIWAAQQATDWAVVSADDPGARSIVERHPPPGRLVRFTAQVPGPDELGVEDGWLMSRLPDPWAGRIVEVDALHARSEHHVANAAAAAAAALCAGAAPGALAGPMRDHRPGPHRLEQVAVLGGVTWVNDSKATNPHAAAAALASYASVVWIAGGLAKGADLTTLGPLLADRAHAVVTVGSAGPQVAALARSLGIRTVEAGTVERAVPAAAQLARSGDTVLLSPACASMDQFADYAARGEAFREAVARLATEQEVVRGN